MGRVEGPASPAHETGDATHQEVMWGRLPFLVPMAARVASSCRRSGRDCSELAPLVAELRSLLLDHLDREDHVLARALEEPGGQDGIVAELHREHLAVLDLLGRVSATALRALPESGGDCAVERAFRRELALIDDHIRAQVELEEELLATWAARRAAAQGTALCGTMQPGR